MKLELIGYIDPKSLIKFRYTPATGFEVHSKHKPIDILRMPRIYQKPLNNFWFKSNKKIRQNKLVKITIEVLD